MKKDLKNAKKYRRDIRVRPKNEKCFYNIGSLLSGEVSVRKDKTRVEATMRQASNEEINFVSRIVGATCDVYVGELYTSELNERSDEEIAETGLLIKDMELDYDIRFDVFREPVVIHLKGVYKTLQVKDGIVQPHPKK